jgi:hypothetical protein
MARDLCELFGNCGRRRISSTIDNVARKTKERKCLEFLALSETKFVRWDDPIRENIEIERSVETRGGHAIGARGSDSTF